MAQFEITWEAPEFEYHEKDVSWYWITIIIAAIIVAFAILTRNFLFGFFAVIAEPVLIILANQKPRLIEFRLTDTELEIGAHKFHHLKEFESWSAIDIGDGWADLAFNFRAKLKIPIKILVTHETLDEIRKNLKTILREVEHETSLIEAIEKLIKF